MNEMAKIPLLASVALIVDVPEQGLSRGQIGTVVEYLHEGAGVLLVEFSDDQGQTYAMADLTPDQLIVLHRRTRAA
jgi:hypothetical protein